MFYGIEVKSNQNQAKAVMLENAVKLTQAVLDLGKNGKKEPVSLVVEYNKKTFVLCNLDSTAGSWQCPLDLIFDAGSMVRFYLKGGSGTVHLTGYETFNELDNVSMSMSSDEEVFDDSDSEPTEAPAKQTTKKIQGPLKKTNGLSSNGKKQVPDKQKVEQPTNGLDDDSDMDSDDFDFDSDDIDNEEDEEDEDEEDEDEEQDEDEDEDEEQDEDDLEFSDDEDEEMFSDENESEPPSP